MCLAISNEHNIFHSSSLPIHMHRWNWSPSLAFHTWIKKSVLSYCGGEIIPWYPWVGGMTFHWPFLVLLLEFPYLFWAFILTGNINSLLSECSWDLMWLSYVALYCLEAICSMKVLQILGIRLFRVCGFIKVGVLYEQPSSVFCVLVKVPVAWYCYVCVSFTLRVFSPT